MNDYEKNLPTSYQGTKAQVSSLQNILDLSNGLSNDTNSYNSSEISVSLLPNVFEPITKCISSVSKTIITHNEFKKRLTFLNSYSEKQFQIECQKIEKDYQYNMLMLASESRLKQYSLDLNTKLEMERINHDYDIKMKTLFNKYNIQKQELDYYYSDLATVRKNQSKVMCTVIKEAQTQLRQNSQNAKELADTCKYYAEKIRQPSASREDKEYYLCLKNLQLTMIQTNSNIFLTFVEKILK